MATEPIVKTAPSSWRFWAVCLGIVCAFAAVLWKSWHLQTASRDDLSEWGSRYQQRVHQIDAKRGMITDRNNQPLAISSRVYSIGIDPRFFTETRSEEIDAAAKILDLDPNQIRARLQANKHRSFFYLRRHINPGAKRALAKLALKGVIIQEEHKRFYPARESFANVIGITDVDDRGLEGLELAFDEWLRGRPGEQRFIRDNRGQIIESRGIITPPKPGRDLRLTLDRRLQHFAFTELQKVVDEQEASAGAMVIVDARNGEILAMVNVPSFNPNNRQSINVGAMRNRGAIDVFEPGSTIKPLTIAAALDSKEFNIDSRIDIGNGRLQIGEFEIKDVSTTGILTVAEVLKYSSNVGASKIAMQLGGERIWRNLTRFGFGMITHSGFPGESSGVLQSYVRWPSSVVVTHGYGYGMSVTLLQLARAYAILADGGVDKPLTFHQSSSRSNPTQVIPAEVAAAVLPILGDIVQDGTGKNAQISGYSVGGKTGTTRKFNSSGGYSEDRYNALFVGISPLSNPRIVCAIIIDDPKKQYYGGQVAAPLYTRVVSVALRLLGIGADRVDLRGV